MAKNLKIQFAELLADYEAAATVAAHPDSSEKTEAYEHARDKLASFVYEHRTALIAIGIYRRGPRAVTGSAKPGTHELSDYYLDVLEWAIPPLTVSVLDKRVSLTAIGVLFGWGYLQKTGLSVQTHPLYETSTAGIEALKRYGRSDDALTGRARSAESEATNE